MGDGKLAMWGVSIHAPRARGDTARTYAKYLPAFQFTPLVRGATRTMVAVLNYMLFQFTPLVRGATVKFLYGTKSDVSIHAPRARGDAKE